MSPEQRQALQVAADHGLTVRLYLAAHPSTLEAGAAAIITVRPPTMLATIVSVDDREVVIIDRRVAPPDGRYPRLTFALREIAAVEAL